eukprot:6192459-Pleurochrysis_carterae.AAC.1
MHAAGARAGRRSRGRSALRRHAGAARDGRGRGGGAGAGWAALHHRAAAIAGQRTPAGAGRRAIRRGGGRRPDRGRRGPRVVGGGTGGRGTGPDDVRRGGGRSRGHRLHAGAPGCAGRTGHRGSGIGRAGGPH